MSANHPEPTASAGTKRQILLLVVQGHPNLVLLASDHARRFFSASIEMRQVEPVISNRLDRAVEELGGEAAAVIIAGATATCPAPVKSHPHDVRRRVAG
jgi:hypothetical protein